MLADVNDLVRVLRRIVITVTGMVILTLGVVLLVAPGPGLLVIALALAVFAVEYEWARRHLRTVQARARSAAVKAAERRTATASAVLFGIGTLGIGALLIFTDLLPLSGVGTGVGAIVAGLTILATTAYGIRELRRATGVHGGADQGDSPSAGPPSAGPPSADTRAPGPPSVRADRLGGTREAAPDRDRTQ